MTFGILPALLLLGLAPAGGTGGSCDSIDYLPGNWRMSPPRLVQAGIYCESVNLYKSCEEGKPEEICRRMLISTITLTSTWKWGGSIGLGGNDMAPWEFGFNGEYGTSTTTTETERRWQNPVGGPCPGIDDPKILNLSEWHEGDDADCSEPQGQADELDVPACVEQMTLDGVEQECKAHLPAAYKIKWTQYARWGMRAQGWNGATEQWEDCSHLDCSPTSYRLATVFYNPFEQLSTEPDVQGKTYHPPLLAPAYFCTGSYESLDDSARFHPDVIPTLPAGAL